MSTSDDVAVNERLIIPAAELRESFARSGGPGGQNVNKVASKVELRWSPAESSALTAADRSWLLAKLRSRLTTDGELVITSSRTRDQSRNRVDARDKLAAILRQALERPKARRPTRPSRGSRERRLAGKKRRASVKQARKLPPTD